MISLWLPSAILHDLQFPHSFPFELKTMSRIFPSPRAENPLFPMYSSTYSPGCPADLPPRQADDIIDMCIIINTSLRSDGLLLRFIARYRPLEIATERVKFVALRTGSHWDGVPYILEDLLCSDLRCEQSFQSFFSQDCAEGEG